MAFKILSTSPTFGHYAVEPVKYLEQHGCQVELSPQGKKLTEEDLIGLVREIDAIIVGFDKMTQRVIGAGRRLKVIAKHGAGTDNIDTEAAARQGVSVISAPGANSDAVADLTLGLMLALARDLVKTDRSVREGNWPRVVGVQLGGKVLGIVGLGQVGRKVAARAAGFGMKIVAHDAAPDEAFAGRAGITYLPLDQLLSESDFVSLNVSLNAATNRLIGRSQLDLMKKDAFLINVSRGEVVDEEALYEYLKEKKIKAAALDVFAAEPLKDSRFAALDNVILSPHMGGYTYDALKDTGMICARGIIEVLAKAGSDS